MNKRGDIPIVILVIGVFAISSLALLTFFVSDFRISNSFVGIEVMDKLNTNINEYYFYSSMDRLDEMRPKLHVVNESGKEYFALSISYDKFSFRNFKTNNVLLFSVKTPVPNVSPPK